MSHFWHKPLTMVASGVVVAGMLVGAGASVASANATHHGTGNVTYSDNQFVDTLNPWQLDAVVDTETTSLTWSPMALWNPQSKFQYLETTTPKVSKNGLTYTFTIHSGMKWSNGDPITANDYIYGWKLGMNSNTGPGCFGSCDDIASISAKGLAVTVKLRAKYGPALSNVVPAEGFLPSQWNLGGRVSGSDLTNCINASVNYSAEQAGNDADPACDAAANAWEDKTLNYFSSSDVSDGPFLVNSYDSTSGQITLSPNSNYTSSMPGGHTSVGSATFLPYGNIAAEIAGAANGDTDLTMDYSLLNVGDSSTPGTLKYYKNFSTLIKSNADPEVLTFNVGDKKVNVDSNTGTAASGLTNPFYGYKNGTLVRDALLMSFDRATMIQNAFAPLDRATAQSLVSYCAPIICTKSASAPYADKSIKGAWDPIAKKYVAGMCAASKSNGGDGAGNAADKDAVKALNKAGFSSKHPLTVYLSSTTKQYRYYEQAYLQKCWQSLGSWVTVNTENILSSKYFGTFSDGGTLDVGNFEADLHGYGGVSPDPDGWKGNFLGKFCAHSGSQTGQNMDCFNDSIINKALVAGGKGTTKAVRQKAYNTFQVENSKMGFWGIMAPLPAIMTSDGHPGGAALDQWTNSTDTWNAYAWT